MRADGGVWPIMTRLSDCLCAELDAALEAGDPQVCFCGVLPGDAVLADYAGAGLMGWVRLVNSYPTTAFPDPVEASSCATMWAHTLEIGIMECVPAFADSTGALPSQEEQHDYARRQLAAMQVLRRAVQCCLEAGGVDIDYVITSYDPVGPQGEVYGGTLSVTVLEV